ncbi:MAG: alkaline phosphatase D family protein [Luminiphilus sp.]|nr:alkaline phosphatase D family protein [Luminiphilus sp.]
MMINRRQLLQGMGAGAGAMSVNGVLAASGGNGGFTHGVASGDPLSDRVILWSRYVPEGNVARAENIIWQVAYDRAFGDIAATGMTSTHRDRDFTVKVDVTGLKSGRRYFYRFVIDGHRSQTGSTKTLPAGDVNRFRLGVASCSNYPQGYFHAYDDMAKSDLDLVLHLGDYIYEYARGRYVNPIAEDTLGRGVEPQNEIVSLDDYRARYAVYRSDKDLQAAHAAHPWICVWDDHELMNNTWRGGAENHNEGEGDFDERIAAARTVYHEWMPIRTAAQTDQAPIYRRFQIGQLADLIMLDTRLQGRDEQLDYQRDIAQVGGPEAFVKNLLMNPQRTILGADQENWLASQLADSQDRGAIWQVIGQQVLMGKLITPLIPKETLDALDLADRYRPRLERLEQIARAKLPLNLDAWDGYPICRERIHGLFKQFAPNPVVLAGDTHNAWAFNMQNQQGEEVGVEIGTPGVTSPGMEAYLPAPSQMMRDAFKASSTELFDLDTTRRGWTVVEMTPTEVTSKWRFVSTILESQYQINESEALLCKAGDKRFSARD